MLVLHTKVRTLTKVAKCTTYAIQCTNSQVTLISAHSRTDTRPNSNVDCISHRFLLNSSVLVTSGGQPSFQHQLCTYPGKQQMRVESMACIFRLKRTLYRSDRSFMPHPVTHEAFAGTSGKDGNNF